MVEGVLEAFVNVAQYQPFLGGSYMRLPEKATKNKKAIINVQTRNDEYLKWALRAALFPLKDGMNVSRPSRYPTEDGLDFTGIDFPTPLSQINRLEKQNPALAINVFGWEKERLIVNRLSEKEGSLLRINLMLIKNNEKSHYTYVRRLSAQLPDESKHGGVKHFCERCLHDYMTAELLERHNPECMGRLKRPTGTELPKEGENNVKFKNHHKQMNAQFVVYVDFESLTRKIRGCAKRGQATIKTEVHEPCGFSYIIVKSDGQTHVPFVYRGKDAVYRFLMSVLNDEKLMRAGLADKKPLVMTSEDWCQYNSATECHIYNESLVSRSFETRLTPTPASTMAKATKGAITRPGRGSWGL